MFDRWLVSSFGVVIITLVCGCPSASQNKPLSGDQHPAAERPDGVVSSKEGPETLLEPFDPPSLQEVDARADWSDQPVFDSLDKLRTWKKMHDHPQVSVTQALQLRNDSPEANSKILSALSQLASEDGLEVNWDAKISRALTQDLRSTNPLLASSASEFEIGGLTGIGLFSFDWKMVPFASTETVVRWQTSADRMMDKVVIRDDLTWSDGRPVTAHDVVFSWKTIMNPRIPIPAMRSGTDKLRWVKAYGDYTLVFFHKKPLATNVWNLNFSIIPQHIYEDSIAGDPTLRKSDYHAAIEDSPVTGGAYELAQRVRGQEIVLKRRESYYMYQGQQVRDKPYFEEIRFRILEDGNTRLLALKAGEIEEATLGAEQWQTQTDGAVFYALNTKVTGLEWTYFYVGWNLKTPYFKDQRVRRAMAYAMDHEEMLQDLCYGLYSSCTGPFHPKSWMYPATAVKQYRQDLDKAEALLDQAGWVDHDGDGIRDQEIGGRVVPFEFTLLVGNKPDRIAICNLMRENLDVIGIVCHVAPLEASVLQERLFKRRFQAYFAGWGAGADPYTSVNVFGTGENRNYVSYTNDEVDSLFEQGEKEFDPQKRATIYGKIHQLIYEDQPYTFLYFRSSFYGFSKKLRGYNFSPRGPFHYGPGFGAIWSPLR